MDKEELETALEQHALWLEDTSQGARADLYDADLSDALLRGVNLSGANLRGAHLSGANLRGAFLRDVYLDNADLSVADLDDADLKGAFLRGADLRGANLSDADLSYADLGGASLRGAHLGGANLRGAHLGGANLDGVRYDADTCFFALQCPEEGAFIGWKKCRNRVIVKLLIPEDAKRSSATTRKCRASKVQVLEVIGGDFGESGYDGSVVYRKGDTIVVNDFDDDRWRECSAGIHFFLTRGEAESYEL